MTMKLGCLLIATFALILFIAGVGAGCSVNRTNTQEFHDPKAKAVEVFGQTDFLTDLIAKQYPDRFNALHRASLNIRGKTIILKGFLRIDRPERAIHLIAQAEMGGTLFEVHIQNGTPDTVVVNGFFKKNWLEESVVKDLKHLYLTPSFDSPLVTADKDGQLILTDKTDSKEGLTRSHIFTPQDRGNFLVSGYRQLRKNRLGYEINYHYGKDPSLPRFITVKNNKLNYTLNLEVRYLIPRSQ
jgi:hypothetical protein